jgi:restriction endonuclease Mrr
MAIPDYQSIMLQLLKCLNNHQTFSMRDLTEQLSQHHGLSEEERAERLQIANDAHSW